MVSSQICERTKDDLNDYVRAFTRRELRLRECKFKTNEYVPTCAVLTKCITCKICPNSRIQPGTDYQFWMWRRYMFSMLEYYDPAGKNMKGS